MAKITKTNSELAIKRKTQKKSTIASCSSVLFFLAVPIETLLCGQTVRLQRLICVLVPSNALMQRLRGGSRHLPILAHIGSLLLRFYDVMVRSGGLGAGHSATSCSSHRTSTLLMTSSFLELHFQREKQSLLPFWMIAIPLERLWGLMSLKAMNTSGMLLPAPTQKNPLNAAEQVLNAAVTPLLGGDLHGKDENFIAQSAKDSKAGHRCNVLLATLETLVCVGRATLCGSLGLRRRFPPAAVLGLAAPVSNSTRA